MFQYMTNNTNFKMGHEQLHRAFMMLSEYKTRGDISEIIRKYGSGEGLSEAEFLRVMEPLVKRKLEEEMQCFNRMRAFFQAADTDHNNTLSEQELVKVLKENFKIDLTPAEIHELVSEIDMNEDCSIDIDEFIGFLTVGLDQQLSEKSHNAVLIIRSAVQYKPSEFVRNFLESPQNFRESFFAGLYRKHKVFPACVFEPKIEPTSLTYTDLLHNKALREKGLTLKVSTTKKLDQVFKGTKLRPLQTCTGALLTLSSA